jgi:microcystin-dependent protein
MSLQNCSNCYNGCTEIVSDKCVRYTGIDVPVLGIKTGDSLSFVEQALITFLTSTLDGTGIKIDLNQETLCDFVKDYLPTCGDITLVDVLNALTEAVCFLKDEVIALEAKFAELEQGYVIECLEGSPDPTSTYEVLQATINKLCQLEIDLIALALDVDTNYVKLADLNALIQAYLDSQSTSNNYSNRMVPYTVVEYYGSLSNFDASGAGIGTWANIYLCNGGNGTPDKRGRIPVGAIQGVPGGPNGLNPFVDPNTPGNPNYALNTTSGSNTVTLTTNQIPSHTHNNIVSITDPGHFHYEFSSTAIDSGADVTSTTYPTFRNDIDGNLSYRVTGGANVSNVGKSSTQPTGITPNILNAAQGGGQSHNNIPPVLACYYIMYIPAP